MLRMMKLIALFLALVIVILLLVLFFVDAKKENEAGPQIYKDLIYVDSPEARGIVTNPLVLAGSARGMWFFEATFPVEIVDSEGNVLAHSFASADGEWMTEEFVPFAAEVPFKDTDAESGEIVLKKANASDLPEFDDELRIPIHFR